ncbi:MAG: Crp/Fnr family transcriptional regulator [Bacteroidota bacterium]
MPLGQMKDERISHILNTHYPFLQTEDLRQLMKLGQYQTFANRAKIVQAGSLNQSVFFILSGMVRGYFLNAKGEEKNIFLRPEHTITGSPDSLFDQQPTKYTFEAIQTTELFFWPFTQLQTLSEQHPNIAKLYIAALTENLQTLLFRVESLVDMSPEERYEALVQRSPQFFQTAFNKHIANYLGMTPVSLSRILKRKKTQNP